MKLIGVKDALIQVAEKIDAGQHKNLQNVSMANWKVAILYVLVDVVRTILPNTVLPVLRTCIMVNAFKNALLACK